MNVSGMGNYLFFKASCFVIHNISSIIYPTAITFKWEFLLILHQITAPLPTRSLSGQTPTIFLYLLVSIRYHFECTVLPASQNSFTRFSFLT